MDEIIFSIGAGLAVVTFALAFAWLGPRGEGFNPWCDYGPGPGDWPS